MKDDKALARLQKTELEILNVFSEFCEKNNISWFIDGGTALGARRHGGFIPWDDDIDVGMLRADYERFVSSARNDFPKGYSVHTPDKTDGIAGMFAKIYMDSTSFDTGESLAAGIQQGIFIDVFPYDRLAADSKVAARQRRKSRLWQNISYLYHSSVVSVPHKGCVGAVERLGCRVAHSLLRFFLTQKTIVRHFNRACRIPESDASDYVLTFAWPEMDGVPIDDLRNPATIEFEGRVFPCPSKIDSYLERMYGDWKILPDESDRKTHLPLHLKFPDGEEWFSSK